MVSSMEEQRKAMAIKLYQISGKINPRSLLVSLQNHVFCLAAFKFGEFTLKSGEISPVYFDLRVIVSHPDVMDQLTDLMLTFIEANGIQCDQLCGVPYTGKNLFSRG
jgi:hypothetical protein